MAGILLYHLFVSFLQVTDMLGISMELGCFLAGVIISSMGPSIMDEIKTLIEPVRDLFGCLFFATIGRYMTQVVFREY